MTDVAYYYIEETGALGEVPASLQNYIDYQAYGRDLDLQERLSQPIMGFLKSSIKSGRSRQALLLADFLFYGDSLKNGYFL